MNSKGCEFISTYLSREIEENAANRNPVYCLNAAAIINHVLVLAVGRILEKSWRFQKQYVQTKYVFAWFLKYTGLKF